MYNRNCINLYIYFKIEKRNFTFIVGHLSFCQLSQKFFELGNFFLIQRAILINFKTNDKVFKIFKFHILFIFIYIYIVYC